MTTIKLKNGSGAPATSDLVQGEPALDLTNKRLYTENASGAVIEIGTNPSTLTVDTTTLVVDASNNRVGVGTASPARTLDVSSGATGVAITTKGSGTGSYITFQDGTTTNDAKVRVGAVGDNLTLFGGGSERMRIDSSGVVGIGTSSPVGILHLQSDDNGMVFQSSSSSNSRTQIFFQNNGGTQRAKIAVDPDGGNANVMAFSTGTTERMRIDSSGNVGINQSAPDAQLTLNPPNYTSTATGGMIKWKNSNNSGHSNIQSYFVAGEGTDINIGVNAYINTFGAWSRWSTGLATSAVSCGRSGNISFITNTSSGNGITRAIIDNSGNLGLGTTAPSSYGGGFVVDDLGINIVTASSSSPGTNKLSWWSDNNGISQNAYISVVNNGATTNTGEMVFYTKNASATLAERMRIDSSGNLLVGVTSATAKLHVDHSSASTPTALFLNQSTASSGVGAVQTSIPSQSNNTNCYHFKGTTQGVASYFLYGNGTSSFTSDERQKKNVVNTRNGYLDDLKRLRVVDYHWNNQEDIEDKSVGLIAQEVEQVFPHLVIEHEMEGVGLRKNIRGSEFTFVLIKAIQEQQAMIEELKAEVAALKGE